VNPSEEEFKAFSRQITHPQYHPIAQTGKINSIHKKPIPIEIQQTSNGRLCPPSFATVQKLKTYPTVFQIIKYFSRAENPG
jgi:hypothetical protein